MSAIGSFYLIADEKRDNIVRAAEATCRIEKKKRFGSLPKLPLNPDPFWEFVSSNTEELDRYPYSGYLLLDIELLHFYIKFEGHRGHEAISDQHSTFISFRPEDAAAVIAILEGSDFSDEAIKTFLNEEGRGTVIIPRSLRQFKLPIHTSRDGWVPFQQVRPGSST